MVKNFNVGFFKGGSITKITGSTLEARARKNWARSPSTQYQIFKPGPEYSEPVPALVTQLDEKSLPYQKSRSLYSALNTL